MSWTSDQLATVSGREEVELVLSLPPHPAITVPVWVVVVDDEVIVRSYTGANSRWFRRAVRHPSQVIRIGDDTFGVTFERMPSVTSIDDAYLEKYARFDYAGAMVKPLATAATLRVLRN